MVVSTMSYIQWTSSVRNAYDKAYGSSIGIYKNRTSTWMDYTSVSSTTSAVRRQPHE